MFNNPENADKRGRGEDGCGCAHIEQCQKRTIRSLGTQTIIGMKVFQDIKEAIVGLFVDEENPWESSSGFVDTRVDSMGNYINPQVRKYVERHKLTYPESVAIGARPPFGRYWDE